jgi:hypothetical protein
MIALLGLGILLFAGFLSNAAYKKNNPVDSSAGLPPAPGSGDVPAWISSLYVVGLLLLVVGVIQLFT